MVKTKKKKKKIPGSQAGRSFHATQGSSLASSYENTNPRCALNSKAERAGQKEASILIMSENYTGHRLNDYQHS